VAIEVLLRKTVESVGRVGEVVRVRAGYARNYLFPQGIGVLPTKENLRLVEKDKVVEEAAESERAKERAELAAKIAGTTVTIEAKANADGHLFGSVGAKQVADALAAKGLPIEERHIRMEPVRQTGESEVKIHLGPDAEPTIKLWVVEELTDEMKAGGSAAPSAPPTAPASPPAPPRAPKRS